MQRDIIINNINRSHCTVHFSQFILPLYTPQLHSNPAHFTVSTTVYDHLTTNRFYLCMFSHNVMLIIKALSVNHSKWVMLSDYFVSTMLLSVQWMNITTRKYIILVGSQDPSREVALKIMKTRSSKTILKVLDIQSNFSSSNTIGTMNIS